MFCGLVVINTNSNDLGTDERESSLRHDRPPAQETALRSRDVVELRQGAWMVPVAETETIVVRSTTQI